MGNLIFVVGEPLAAADVGAVVDDDCNSNGCVALSLFASSSLSLSLSEYGGMIAVLIF